jgi:hypothetical protein
MLTQISAIMRTTIAGRLNSGSNTYFFQNLGISISRNLFHFDFLEAAIFILNFRFSELSNFMKNLEVAAADFPMKDAFILFPDHFL